MRAFVAVEIPEDLLKTLAGVQAGLKSRGVRARWTRPENLHLTLKFLGVIAAGQLDVVTQALRSTAAAHGAFTLTAAGIGVFPGLRRPRVLWAGLSGATDALMQLQRELDDRLEAFGFSRDARGFHGHLTLGRFTEEAGAGGIAAAISGYAAECFGGFDVQELVLFQSDLKPKGPVYTVLARAQLRAQG